MRMSIVLLATCLSLPALAQDEPPTGAKEAFFDPQRLETSSNNGSSATTHKPAPPREPAYDGSGRRIARSSPAIEWTALGLSYWIELAEASGESRIVTDQQTFRSGDRIRIHFRANTNGRIMLMQVGASGTPAILFPDASKGASDNLLRANDEHILPTSMRWFRFDNNAGTERLLVAFAKTQEELDHLPQAVLDTSNPEGKKDLMIETDTEHKAEVATYAVNVAGKPIVLQIILKHR